MHPDSVGIIGAIAAIFEGLSIPYAIGGSIASSLHGEPRSTHDVDVLVDLRAERIAGLVAALEREFIVHEPSIRSAVANGSSFQVLHGKFFIKVDLFVCGPGLLDREQLARAVSTSLPGSPPTRARVTAAENIVLRKLDWYRRSDATSDRQWRDVLGVLKVRGRELDLEYLRRVAEQTGLAQLLSRALRDSGLDRTTS